MRHGFVRSRRCYGHQVLCLDDWLSATRASPLIDVRSPREFKAGSAVGALNWPVLNDEEFHLVGSIYKEDQRKARSVAVPMILRNIAAHLEKWNPIITSASTTPFIFCRRGGSRSKSLAVVLHQMGMDVSTLQGGYQEYRARVCRDLLMWDPFVHLGMRVLAGPTGVGKTRLLQVLQREGAQVLDLEALANHRGSVFGALGPQPCQASFENSVWDSLRRFDPIRPVFVECESARIGNVQVPNALMQRIRQSQIILDLHLALPHRVGLILQEYAGLTLNPESLVRELFPLLERMVGGDVISRWISFVKAGAWHPLVEELIELHYDPVYERSLRKNFVHLKAARVVDLGDGSDESMTRVARCLVKEAMN